MTQPLHRTQILLEPQQHQELTRIAAREDRSLSDLLREIVRRDLERRQTDEERVRREQLEAIQRIHEHRKERLAKLPPDARQLDYVEELRQAREERADELWEAVRGRLDRR